MNRKKILISGSTGQLGSELQQIAQNYSAYEFIFKNRKALDLSSESSIKENFQNQEYDYFINAAAYTAVDKAEEEVDLCYKINSEALKHICQHINSNCRIIHISTDYVYNQNPGRPLLESDSTHAEGIYAKSKLAGEEPVLNSSDKNIIIRTSWVYSTFGHNFVKTMLRLSKIKDNLSIVSDQIGSPTYARDIALCIMQIIEKIDKDFEQTTIYGGVYNFSNLGKISWNDFAQKIFDIKKADCKITPITTEEFNAPAHRPKWSVLSMEKLKNTFNVKISNWDDSLMACLDNID